VWLPGSMFASAWVEWDFFFGYASWRPLGLFDWMSGYGWTEGTWNEGADDGPSPVYTAKVIRKDALKQPSAGSLPIPAELKGVVKKVTSAYERGDVRIRDSAAAAARQLVIVAKGDLTARAINEKALTFDQVAKQGGLAVRETAAPRRVADPRREAARIFRGADGPAASPRAMTASGAGSVRRDAAVSAAAPARPAASAPARFRDWNSDLRIARELGVHIEYSSLRNEIRCPELQFSSRDREGPLALAPRLTRAGVGYSPAATVDGQTGGSGSSGGTESSTSSPSRTASGRSSSSSGSKSSGESGKVKK